MRRGDVHVRIHYAGLVFCVSFLVGLVVGLFSGFETRFNVLWIIGSVLLLPLVVALLRMKLFSVVTLVVASGFMIGNYLGVGAIQERQQLSTQAGKSMVISGRITDDVRQSAEDGKLQFALSGLSVDGREYEGKIWVNLASQELTTLKRGDSVEVKGFALPGFGAYGLSLGRAEVMSLSQTSNQDIGLQARDTFAAATEGSLPEPERSLGLGYLLGMKTNLPEDLSSNIQMLGLTHIVVASGYNLTILVNLARGLFQKISKYLSFATGLGMVGSFIAITGFSPSMTRAGLVATLSLLAWYYGRKFHPIKLLIYAASITLAYNPSYLLGDVGWYLSFTAFAGILIIAPLITRYFYPDPDKVSLIPETVIATFSAQLATLPIILHVFGSFSLLSIVANVLIVPIIPFAMLSVFVSGLSGLLLPFLAGIISLPAVWILKYCTLVINFIASFELSPITYKADLSHVMTMYGIGSVLVLWLMFKTKHRFVTYSKKVEVGS